MWWVQEISSGAHCSQDNLKVFPPVLLDSVAKCWPPNRTISSRTVQTDEWPETWIWIGGTGSNPILNTLKQFSWNLIECLNIILPVDIFLTYMKIRGFSLSSPVQRIFIRSTDHPVEDPSVRIKSRGATCKENKNSVVVNETLGSFIISLRN